jgi:hypothetical protein
MVYTAVHIGGESSQVEAEDHANDERVMRAAQGEKSRDFEAKTLEDVLAAFDTLRDEQAQVKHLDFHAHGYDAHTGHENGRIDQNSLPKFRNRG